MYIYKMTAYNIRHKILKVRLEKFMKEQRQNLLEYQQKDLLELLHNF